MPALICPRCSGKSTVLDSLSGQEIPCPVCSAQIVLSTVWPALAPGASAEATTSFPPHDPDATVAPAPVAATPGDERAPPGYEVLAELGRGGMGVVYRARHVALNRVVALKMILSGAHAAADEMARFRTEAEAIARLQHPGIVVVHEIGEHDGRPFMALEFCSGGSLEKKLAGIPLQPNEAAALVEKLAEAMQAAHSANVIHRDLKPANVLLTSPSPPNPLSHTGERESKAFLLPPLPCVGEGGWGGEGVKITDFGLAKKLGEQGQTVSGAIMGTPSYMAPEQAEGKKDVGPAADLYSLGAILYECLTGRPPFRAATPFDTIMQVVTEEPVPPRNLNPGVPRDLETIALKCLRKTPGQRYGSAAELASDLGRWSRGEPIRARPTPLWERGWKWCRRRPTAAALIAVSMLALAGLMSVGAWYNQQLKRERDYALDQEEIATLERIDAEKARDAAEKAREQSEKRRLWAEHNFKKANEAVDAMLAEVGETWLKFTPQAAPIRKILLEKALTFYQEFLDDRQDDPVIRRQVAQAHVRVANIQSLLGEDRLALDHLTKAIAVSRPLAAGESGDPKARLALALALSDLGSLHRRLGRKDPAERAYLEALAVLVRLWREEPNELDHPKNMGGLLNNLGLLSDAPTIAVPRFEEAAKLFREVIARDAKRGGPRSGLAATSNNLSLILLRQGETDRAEKVLRDGIALLEGLSKDAVVARIQGSEEGLAKLRCNLGDIYLKRGKWELAEALYAGALLVFDKQAREQTRAPEYRLQLAMAHTQLALILRETRRPTEAQKHDDLALLLLDALVADFPAIPEHRDRLASLLNSRGVHLERAGQLDLAEKTFSRALELYTGLADEQTREHRHVEGRAMVHNNLAKLYLVGGKQDRAEKEFVQALRLREDLAKANPKVPRYRADVAAGHNNLANVYLTLGKADAAARSFRQAIRDWKALIKDQPAVPEYIRNLAKAYYNLGSVRGRGNGEAAIEAYDEALQLLVPLVEAHPKVAQFSHDLAQTRANRAIQLYQAGRVSEAEKDFVAVTPIFQRLYDEYPDQHEYLKDVSIAHHTLGMVYLGMKRPAKAKQELDRALEMRRRLVKKHGDVPEYHELLGGTLATLGQYHWQRNERDEAGKLYDEALGLFEGLHKKYPKQVSFTVSLARIAFNQGLFAQSGAEHKKALAAFTLGAKLTETLIEKGILVENASDIWLQCRRWRAMTLGELGRHKEAVADLERVFELVKDDGIRGLLRPTYALELARAGDHVRASAEGAKLARQASNAEEQMGVARVYAVCVAAVATVKDAEERERLAKAYATQAVKRVEKLTAAQRRELEKDRDFEAVRKRAEWKE